MSSSTCNDSCGWAAAVISCLAFGSFGVPIKGAAANSVDIDPLVFQSYKTFMCFLTSWLVLLLGQELTYTPWGIVSGLFWVPGGVAAIYAIRSAGLGVSLGIGSTFIVLVSFTWGIFIFHEGVRTILGASIAIFFMVVGLWGMSYYSSPEQAHSEEESTVGRASSVTRSESEGRHLEKYQEVETDEADDSPYQSKLVDDIIADDESSQRTMSSGNPLELSTRKDSERRDTVNLWGYKICRRRLGLAGAVFNGVWGGSIMVPMHYSKRNTGGLGYVISFAIGASIVTLFLWVLRYCYHVVRTGSFTRAYRSLPSFHIRVMWLPGGIAGTLWSIGNLCSIISVQYLGEAVGYSVTQAAMLTSGLWGIFYFKEVEGCLPISKWFLSASITVAGILLLSYEHQH